VNYLEKKLNDWKKDYIDLQSTTQKLREELDEKKTENCELTKQVEELTDLNNYYEKKLLEWQEYYVELQKTTSGLRDENKTLKKKQLKSFKKGDNRKRGGCKLTDIEIERLLMIFAKKGKYANISKNRAIQSISQTSQTLNRVIRRDYRSEETKVRIELLAKKNNIELPERGKLK